MSGINYQGAWYARKERQRQESIRVEPDWADIEASKSWLEERYPLLEDASSGSPLFRYMKACVEDGMRTCGSAPKFLASMLSFQESMRYSGETNFPIGYDPNREKLYPDRGFPKQYHVPEPIWSDIGASKDWLEKRYPLGVSALGSPLFQYMKRRFLNDCPDAARHRQDVNLRNILYPEYNARQWADSKPFQQDPEVAKMFTPGWPHPEHLPPLANKQPMFQEAYPPHLRRQSSKIGLSSKRKGDDGNDAPLEHHANKRRRQPSDFSGGVVMSAESPNFDEGHDSLRHQNVSGPMLPPPRPQQKAVRPQLQAGITNLEQQRKKEEELISSRPDTIEVTRTPPHLTSREDDTRNLTGGLGLNLLLTPIVPSPAIQSHQRVESPENVGSAQIDFQKKRSIDEVEDEESTSSEFKKRRASPNISGRYSLVSSHPKKTPLAERSEKISDDSMEDPSLAYFLFENRPTSSNSGVNESPMSSSSAQTPLAAACRKRSIEDVEDVLPTNSPPKRNKTPPDSDSTHLLPSSPSDPPERSTSILGPRLDETPTNNRAIGANLDSTPPSQRSPSREDPSSIVVRPNEVGYVLQSCSQSGAIDGGRSPEATSTDDQPTAHLGHLDGALNGDGETQEHVVDVPMPLGRESQSEHYTNIREDPDDTRIEYEHPTSQMNTQVIQNSRGRPVQTAISVVVPSHRPAANQERSPDEETVNAPVIRNKRKGGRKASSKGGKGAQSERQGDQGKRKPQTKVLKPRQSKLERERHVYVGRLRSGIGGRKHEQPRLVVLGFKGRKAVQVPVRKGKCV